MSVFTRKTTGGSVTDYDFDAATQAMDNQPDISLVSTAAERDGPEWSITGDLPIKAVSRSARRSSVSSISRRSPRAPYLPEHGLPDTTTAQPHESAT